MEGLNGWTVQGDSVKIEGNGDNDVKAGVVKEQVELSRESRWTDQVVNEHGQLMPTILCHCRVDEVDLGRCPVMRQAKRGSEEMGVSGLPAFFALRMVSTCNWSISYTTNRLNGLEPVVQSEDEDECILSRSN